MAPVLPRFVSLRILAVLWAVQALLVGAGLAVAWRQVPLYTPGVGVVVSAERRANGPGGGLALVVFFAPQDLPRLRSGQPLLLETASGGPRARGELLAVEPELLSPASAVARFGLSGAAAHAVTQPVACASAAFEPQAAEPAASAHLGGVYQVNAEVGSQSLFSLLTGIGRRPL